MDMEARRTDKSKRLVKKRAGYDRYWEIIPSLLGAKKQQLFNAAEEAGYLVANMHSVTTVDLEEIIIRLDTEKPTYDGCTMIELRKFAQDRRIHYTEGHDERSSIIYALQCADDSQTFPKFMDLTPELRACIVDHYIAGFPEWILLPSQPPLARTNRLLRAEILPIFRGSCGVRLRYIRDWNERKKVYQSVKATDETALWLFTVGDEGLRLVRRLQLHVRRPHPIFAKRLGLDVTCEVERQGNGRSHGRVFAGGYDDDVAPTRIDENDISRREGATEVILKTIGARGLGFGDLRALAEAVEKNMRPLYKA